MALLVAIINDWRFAGGLLVIGQRIAEGGGGQGLAAFWLFFEQKNPSPKILKKNLHLLMPAKAL